MIEIELKIKAIYSMEIMISMLHYNYESANEKYNWLVFSRPQMVI